jgi:hypothetical protein
VGLLIAVPIASISYSFGAGSKSSATTQQTISMIQQSVAQQQQAMKDVQTEETKLSSMTLNDNEKQMHTVLQKIEAASAAGAQANKQMVDAMNQLYSAQKH